MTIRSRTIFSIITLLITIPSCVFPQDHKYLSDAQPGYKAIEILQQRKCHGPCLTADRNCAENVMSKWIQMFNEHPPQLMIDTLCSRVSTRYETPGVYWLLNRYLKQVQAAAKVTYGGPIIDAKIGSLPLFDVNAGAKTKDDEPLILVHLGFFLFAHECGKVTARTINVKLEGDYYVIDGSEEGFDQLVKSDPRMVNDFEETVTGFIDGHTRAAIDPGKFVQTILAIYDKGMEIFAIGHEYGHLLSKNKRKSSHEFHLDDNERVSVPEVSMLVSNWADEFEADYISCVLSRKVFSTLKADSSGNIFTIAIDAAPQFYFTMKAILDDAKSIIKTGVGLPPPQPAERKLIDKFKQEHGKPGFDVSKFLAKNRSLTKKLKGHPHPILRKELVELMIPVQKDTIIGDFRRERNACLQLSDNLSENCQRLGHLVHNSLQYKVAKK